MKIDKAIECGFKLFEDGYWRKPIKQKQKNGSYINTWVRYIIKSCEKCNEKFLTTTNAGRYCSAKCAPIFNNNPGWRKGKKFTNERGGVGNKRIASNGYVEIYLPGHPIADFKGRVLEHRLVIFNEIKRTLTFNDVVHHINGIRNDNRRENLVLLTRGKHNSSHKSEEVKHRKRTKKGRFV